VHASVCFTVTTADDELGAKVEPGAPLVSARFRAARILAERSIQVGITLMPVLPYLEDSEENIVAIVTRAHECGVSYIVPWFGMSMRDRQRAYYYEQLDRLFPGTRQKCERRYGNRYSCPCPNAARLAQVFHQTRERYGIATGVKPYRPPAAQLSLF
jgi:DNA repair photolyase